MLLSKHWILSLSFFIGKGGCMENDFVYQILNLTDAFYNEYSGSQYKEIMKKRERPYNCLLLQSHYDYFICIPYRSNINHKNAYFFKGSRRSKRKKSGLDFSKILIIKEPKYIGTSDAIIDKDEYNETYYNIGLIKNEAEKYVDGYVNDMMNRKIIHKKEFKRKYQFSTLKYFHKELKVIN